MRASGYIGVATNNTAEYLAVINALAAALKAGYRSVHLFSDSELVVRQIRGEYRVRKEHLRPLWSQVAALCEKCECCNVESVPREHRMIGMADRMCNDLLDLLADH
jgi:ribonuclease HI